MGQGLFTTGGSDPSKQMPTTQDSTYDNFWIDVQISNAAPSGYSGSYRLWPNKYDANSSTVSDSAANYIIATEIDLVTGPCTLNKIWYYSPHGTAQLATRASVWSISSRTEVAANASPSWSGAAGSGWVSCSFSGVTLNAGNYRVAVYNGVAAPDQWSATDNGTQYWAAGVGKNGITNGPLSAPNLSAAQPANIYMGSGTTPGQSVFALGPPNQYPNVYVTGQAQNYWLDLEVTPN